MVNILGLGGQTTVDVSFPEGHATASVKAENGSQETLPLFTDGDAVQGSLWITPPPGKKVEHQGVRVELLGQIEPYFDRSHSSDFLSLVRELEGPGSVTEPKEIKFDFGSTVAMPYESYVGLNVRCRYLLRVTIQRGFGQRIVKEFKLWVRNVRPPPEMNSNIKMEVGIEDCLHIEFEYSKSAYSLIDVVVGKIYFLLVKIKIKHMEVEIRRRESVLQGPNAVNEMETLAKFEIMDGAPVRGESVPVRLFLSPYALTPSYTSVANKFSVKYFINLVLVDEEDRRYFKQHEILLHRSQI